ncbi:NAD(P)-dependent malic enzyme [Paenibacillus flagellatus]|uniref:NAD-dependent malic enzyme n=1 Tax=Paenibacillus flagellatus TaxID=2211139 RepID=A0A2V5KUL0_9BACL|nr:malic enzyme-like NAD(P)-binding protein [Paenibacillus flagellatus]PYI55627.1 NAD-dependent malic enzyme [Paenibacillus flagellatus]
MIDLKRESLELHKRHRGKLEVVPKVPLGNSQDLSLAYSPGVAVPCLHIADDGTKAYDYTVKGNLVAIATNGTAVLGLGDIGPLASLPVMEGKAALFKSFGGVDAVPICLDSKSTDDIVFALTLLSPTFGGINLEDIAAPQCFEIEERLKRSCDIPVFHDDQHGTAIVTAAGLINALRIVGKTLDRVRIVVNGAGAAGIATVDLLHAMGAADIVLCDTNGIVYEGRPNGMNPVKARVATITNPRGLRGALRDAVREADVFIGVSAAGALHPDMLRSMAPGAIVFALANPDPEIMPEEAKRAGAVVVATGRSDYPNQINNVLAFPGVFRGALDVRAAEINEAMKMAAVYAIAGLIAEPELRADYVVPAPFDPRVAESVAVAVASAALETGCARAALPEEEIVRRIRR